MNLLIFKTNLENKSMVSSIKPLFNNHSLVTDWNVDLEDTDKILRVETSEYIEEQHIISLIQTKGFRCEILRD